MARSGRPRGFDRTVALEAAMHLFWAHGYEATSLAQLKAAMGGLSSASFYAAFKSKEALFREAVRRYLDTHGQVVASLYDSAVAPRDAVERALRGSARMQTDRSHPAGCLVVLSTLTSAPENSHLQALLAAERSANRAALAACVRRAVEQGDLPIQADEEAMATLLDGYLVGLSTQARDGVPVQQLEAAITQLMALWDALGLSSRRRRSGSTGAARGSSSSVGAAPLARP